MRLSKRLTRQCNDQRGVSLVVVVFTLMILAILGWTLASFIAGDFESNARNLESEQALYIAEAGIQEALGRLNRGDAAFDNDSDILYRRLSFGEYNVTRNAASGNVNITSRGYVPAENGYRALRQVSVVALSGGTMNAISGGELFDWHNVTSINIDGDIVAASFEGNDWGFVLNQDSDLNIAGQGNRTQSTTALPAIDMQWYRDHADVYKDGNTVFTKNVNNAGIIFVDGTAEIRLYDNNGKAQKLNFEKTSIIARDGIVISGDGALDMTTHVYNPNQPNERTFPNMATQYGDIIMSCTTSASCGKHTFDGLIYTQYGTLDLSRIDETQNTALIGRIVRLRGSVDFNCFGKRRSKYINLNNGFNAPGNATAIQWREE